MSTHLHDRIRPIYYAEVLINFITIIMLFITPNFFLQNFGIDATTPLISETFLWFGALMIVITFILARALIAKNYVALRYVLEGYLIGDFAYLYAQIRLLNAMGDGWSLGAIVGIIITLILITSRILYLWSDYQNNSIQDV